MERQPGVVTVGFVGLGVMGRPIAQWIAGAGYPVLAYDIQPGQIVDGVQIVGTLSEVAAADVVIVIVPTDEDVIEVISGGDGLLASSHPGQTIVISASVSPATCRELAASAASLGVDVIDAALTGGVRGAEEGRINLLIGGDQSIVDRLEGIFKAFATGTNILGPVGAGQVGKSANNLIHWAQIVAIDEALRFAGRLGVHPTALRAALQEGPTDSRTLRELEQMRFTWYVKDIEIAQALAAEVDLTLPVAACSRRLMDDVTVKSVRELLEVPARPL
jgi:3-hydroxyisobutyrate dehydrogenase